MNSGVIALPLMATDVSAGSDTDCREQRFRPYLAGEENALLRTLVDAALRQPPHYNPIVLYGPTGVGKSHLLRGLTDRFGILGAQRKPLLMAAADFARSFVSAVEVDSVMELRERWSMAGFVAIDGLEELSTKPAAQQELLHLVHDCCERDRQFLAACRSAPDDWGWMPAGLRSRLLGGLTIPVALPQASARFEIVRQLADEFGLSLPAATMEKLAGTMNGHAFSRTNYLQLRGAVSQFLLTASGSAGQYDDVAESEPGERGGDKSQECTRRIAKLVSRHFEMKLTVLLGSSRRKTVVRARGIAIHIARSLLGASFKQLGRSFGNRDHTTILHAYWTIDEALRSDAGLKQIVDKLKCQAATLI